MPQMRLPRLNRRQTQQAFTHNLIVRTQKPPSSKYTNLTLRLALTDVTAEPLGSPVPGSLCAPVDTPTIQILPPQPETSVCEDPAPSQAQGALPQTETAQSLDINIIWAEAMKIAEKKLGGNKDLPLYLKDLSSQLPGGNIRAVIEALDTLQKAEKDKRLHYTWNGKKVVIVEQLGKFLRIAEPYLKAVDTGIQHDPVVAAPVWAGIWTIMRVGIHLRCQLLGDIYTDSMTGYLESCGDD